MSDVSKTKTKTRGQQHWFVACRPRLPSAFVFGNVGISRRSRVAKSADDGRLHAGLYTCLQSFMTSAPTNSITSICCGSDVDFFCGLGLHYLDTLWIRGGLAVDLWARTNSITSIRSGLVVDFLCVIKLYAYNKST